MENQKRYRLTPRQSEIAVRISGNSQADLFANSAFALFDVMTDVEKVDIKDRVSLEVKETDRNDLMVNWMRELLYLYQESGYLLKEFHIQETKDTLMKTEVCNKKINPNHHEINKEILGITYHQ